MFGFTTPAQQNDVLGDIAQIATGSFIGGSWGDTFNHNASQGPIYTSAFDEFHLVKIVALLDDGSPTSDNAVKDSNNLYYGRVITPLNGQFRSSVVCDPDAGTWEIPCRVSRCDTLHEGEILLCQQVGLSPNTGDTSDQGWPWYFGVLSGTAAGWAYSAFHTTADDLTLTWDGGEADGTKSGGVTVGTLFINSDNKIEIYNNDNDNGKYFVWQRVTFKTQPDDNYFTLLTHVDGVDHPSPTNGPAGAGGQSVDAAFVQFQGFVNDSITQLNSNLDTINDNYLKTPALVSYSHRLLQVAVELDRGHAFCGGYMDILGTCNHVLNMTSMCMGLGVGGTSGSYFDADLIHTAGAFKAGGVNIEGLQIAIKLQQTA